MKLSFQFATSVLIPLLITAPLRAEMQSSDRPSVPQLHLSLIERDSETVLVGSESSKGFTLQVTDSAGAPVADSAVVFRLPDEGASGTFADASRSAIVYTAADGRARISGIKWSETPGSVSIKVTATKGEARAGFLLSETLSAQSAPVTASAAPAPAEVAGTPPPAAAPAIAPAQTGAAAASPGKSTPLAALDKGSLPRASAPSQPSAEVPIVSVVNSKTGGAGYRHSSYKKWIIITAIVVGAAAGAGLALGSKSKSTSSSPSTSGVSVGTPSISVGQP